VGRQPLKETRIRNESSVIKFIMFKVSIPLATYEASCLIHVREPAALRVVPGLFANFMTSISSRFLRGELAKNKSLYFSLSLSLHILYIGLR